MTCRQCLHETPPNELATYGGRCENCFAENSYFLPSGTPTCFASNDPGRFDRILESDRRTNMVVDEAME